ncbi:hypothetical protein [Portibacter lacus]|uniref:Uncharacterized protein n=1 Tax=Portibacter lacus TaxID=1099794 RepID=A0AA37SVX2_9BACT|nr:hypothetical protein [Portibacter lacus]GLR19836.1 hypothetical protein GCM10007940_44520 [Portibacter lacus]
MDIFIEMRKINNLFIIVIVGLCLFSCSKGRENMMFRQHKYLIPAISWATDIIKRFAFNRTENLNALFLDCKTTIFKKAIIDVGFLAQKKYGRSTT